MTANRDRFPIIEISGTPRERGRAHGEHLRDLIAEGLTLWFERLAALGNPPQSTITRFLDETGHLQAATKWTPAVIDEIRGISEGAGVAFETMFAYNLADEQEVFLKTQTDRCTAIGVRTGVNGIPISGQTMDTPGWFDATKVVLSIHQPEDSLDLLSFTVAGIAVLCGVNSAAVSVWCNAVYQLAPSTHGVPVVCIARTILSQTALEDAKRFIHRVPHASGQNYLLGSEQGLCSLECSANAVAEARPHGNATWHTNHPVVNEDRVNDHAGRNSLARDLFVGERLQEAVDQIGLEEILSDRSVPICKIASNAEGFSHTLWGVVVEHTVPPRVHATARPSAGAEWRQLTFPAAPFDQRSPDRK